MKYLLFAGSFYYPSGGILDITGKSDCINELKHMLVERAKDPRQYNTIDWFQIVEKESMTTVCASDSYDKYYAFDNFDEIELINLDELKKDHQSR